MPVYQYYAVFIPVEDKITVAFPDLVECLTFGNNLLEALDMAEETLRSYLLNLEMKGDSIPFACPANAVIIPDGASLFCVEVNTDGIMVTS